MTDQTTTVEVQDKAQQVVMLIIDPQVDFHPGGSLPVQGAIEDSERIAGLIQAKGSNIARIMVTLDTHRYTHIAHAMMWRDSQGANPQPFTLISAEDVRSGKWRAARPDKQEHYLRYCEGLEAKGKFQLCIWPEHCIEGTEGHAVFPSVFEALKQWQGETAKGIDFVKKGMNEDTEMYSAISAEFPIPSDPETLLNEDVLRELEDASSVIICGQAMSHCVNFTVRDIISNWNERQKDCSKLVVLSDGSSPVTGFEQSAGIFLEHCAENKVRVMRTEDVVKQWDSL